MTILPNDDNDNVEPGNDHIIDNHNKTNAKTPSKIRRSWLSLRSKFANNNHNKTRIPTSPTRTQQRRWPWIIGRKHLPQVDGDGPSTDDSEATVVLLQQHDQVNAVPQLTASTQSETKQVKFSTATIHYHALILGDSPSVTCGAPLALGRPLSGESDIIDVSQPHAYERDADKHETDSDDDDDDANVSIVKMISYVDTMLDYEDDDSDDDDNDCHDYPPRTDWTRQGSSRPLQIPSFVRTQMLLDAGVPEKEIERTIVFHNLERQALVLNSSFRPSFPEQQTQKKPRCRTSLD